MAVIRVEKNKNYTCMANYHLRDKRLSLKAKGLLSVILSLPDDWKYSMAGLVAICKEGESAVKAAFKELERAGYITVTKLYPNQTETGRIEYLYTIHEKPQEQGTSKQEVENLGVDYQRVENQGQLNTDVPSTDKPNTKDKTSETDLAAVIAYLNEKAGRKYRLAKASRKLIAARFADGYTLDDFKRVIDNMVARWKGTEWEQYLQPSTLFAQSHFDEYLNKPATTQAKPQQQGGFDAARYNYF